MYKIAFLTNILTPYQLDFGCVLNNEDDIEYRIYTHRERHQNHSWLLSKTSWARAGLTVQGIADELSLWQPNLLIFGGYKTPLLRFFLSKRKLNGAPKIVIWQEPIPNRSLLKTTLRHIALKQLMGRVDAVIGIGKIAQRQYLRYNKNTHNISYSIDCSNLYKIQRKPTKTAHFLFSGQLIDRKNALKIVAAFKRIPRCAKATLTIIGSGPQENELREIAGNDANIEITGFIQPKQLPTYFEKANVFILPSKYDGWAVVINEAMAAGMPIIATSTVNAANDLIIHGYNGYICQDSEDSIICAMTDYALNTQYIYQHGLRNQDIVRHTTCDSQVAAIQFQKILTTL